mmetsp:Transcript_50097/g.119206  ORF Transcript_50097/g.119206 Transcript_50097/m.119206 type:complete len:385 (+) Transcript_50097:124-1278(+)
MLRGSAAALSLPSLVSTDGVAHRHDTRLKHDAKQALAKALQKSSSVAIPLPSLPAAQQQQQQLAVKKPSPRQEPGAVASRHWTSERRRLLHEERERAWLRSQAKHQFIDFSDSERKELRRYFDALAENENKVRIDKLEDMLISLGLAADREEVLNIVNAVHGACHSDLSRELDFDEFLAIVRTRADFGIFRVFKAMMEGRLGDANLNFQTVISTYRRQLIMDGTGAGNQQVECQERGARILQNFAALQKSRTKVEERARSTTSSRGGPPGTGAFDASGSSQAPLGGLVMMWRGVCHEQNLVLSRPASSDKKTRHSLDAPPSPRTVIDNIISPGKGNMGQFSRQRGTVFIMSDDLNKSLASRDSDGETAGKVGPHSPAFSMRIID